ncbi:MAG: sulfotransferase family protein [Acidimicrobiales bacterium]
MPLSEPPPLPNFLVIGAFKCGTTSLFEYLRSHPQVFMPEAKELGFFVAEHNWNRGAGWYREQFRTAGSATAIGEASPAYSCHPLYAGVPARIAATLPGARLVYLIREPIERMRSQYRHRVANGCEHRPFSTAVLESPAFIELSRYATQLERYLAYFGPSQILVVSQESLRFERADTMRRVFEFLDVEAGWLPPNLNEELNVSHPPARVPEPLVLPPATARYVAKVLEPEMARLCQLLGSASPGWALAPADSS